MGHTDTRSAKTKTGQTIQAWPVYERLNYGKYACRPG